MQVGVRQLSRG